MFGMEPHIQTLYDDDDDDATNYGYDAYDEYGTDYDHSYMVIWMIPPSDYNFKSASKLYKIVMML